MLGFTFLLLFTLRGSFAHFRFGVCDVDECSAKFRKELEAVITRSGDPPTITAIKKSCSGLLKLADCAEDMLFRCTGEKLEDLKSSENITISMASTITYNLRKVVTNICNDSSDLQRGYIKNFDCVTKLVRKNDITCWKEGRRQWTKFLALQNIDLEGSINRTIRDETNCIEAAFGTSCFSLQIGYECGEEAKKVFINIGFKGLEILKTFFCFPTELSDLRYEFLSSLDGDWMLRNTLLSALEGSDFVENSGRTNGLALNNMYVLSTLLVTLISYVY